jgi:bacillolysin
MSRRSVALLAASLAIGAAGEAQAGEPRRVAAASRAEAQAWEGPLQSMVSGGGLALRRWREDTLLPDRRHARYAQVHRGVPVLGGDLAVQVMGTEVVSVFGTLFEGIDVDAVAALSADQAMQVVERLSGQHLGPLNPPELGVLPLETGAFALVYTVPVFTESDRIVYSIDAHTGAIVQARSEVQTESVVGKGKGVLGDDKKMSVRSTGGQFLGDDLLRPPTLETLDGKGDLTRALNLLNGAVPPRDSDLIADSDNTWTDAPAVDAHAYAGYTYDFYYRRFGRRGLDGADLPLRSIVHPVRLEDFSRYSSGVINLYFANAFYAGNGAMLYGEGLPPGETVGGQHFEPFSGALDVVAHELTHGVTQYTSRLSYQGESGALNESFSDMMGTSAEFFFQPPGSGPLKADYLLAEDITSPGAVRSMEDPRRFGQPDHYTTRYLGPLDNGGVHINCSIPNQVFYLAIEGGRNRTSGLSVTGVGPANREQIEKVMYRAFTLMMPASATFAVARQVTLQSARDLYGADSPAERAVSAGWTAVGVP